MRKSLVSLFMFICLFTLPVKGNLYSFDFRVTDAEYSDTLDKIVIASNEPSNRLCIVDPISKATDFVDLPLSSSCVSIDPTGYLAAVGHDGYLSLIDLETISLLEVFPVSTDVFDVVLAGNGWIYAFPRRDQWERIRCIEIETGEESTHTGASVRAGSHAKLHPNGTAIYAADNGLSPSDIEKYSIINGYAEYLYDSPYHGDFSMCGDLWMSDDGFRIFTRCGNVFRASDLQGSDMLYNGSFSELSWLQDVDHSVQANSVVAIPGNGWSSYDQYDHEIQIYSYEYLAYSRTIGLPDFNTPTGSYQSHGRFVFWNSTGTSFTVIVQADGDSGLLNDYGMIIYPRDIPVYDLIMHDTDLSPGDTFLLERKVNNLSDIGIQLDEYIILDVFGELWFWPSWEKEMDWRASSFDAATEQTEEILRFTWPDISDNLDGIRFWGAILWPGSNSLIAYEKIEWGW